MTEKTAKKVEIAIRSLCEAITANAEHPGAVTAEVNRQKAEAVKLLAEALAAESLHPAYTPQWTDGMTIDLKG